MTERAERRLAAILAADVAGYSRLMGADEEGTLAALKRHRSELLFPKVAEHRGRVVKTTGDGALIEFASAVEALRCAVEVQRAMAARNAGLGPDKRIEFRLGVNVGDVIVDGDDIYGDGVNVAARLEALGEPGAVYVSGTAFDQIKGKLAVAVQDLGAREVKNMADPIRVYRIVVDGVASPAPGARFESDRPSIAVLPFANMSGDPGQEFFADGMAEDIITGLSKVRGLFVIARNSTFSYKGKAVDVKHVARDLGVRYVLEGSVRKAGSRVRVTVQLVDATTNNHLWAERYDRDCADIFAMQDEITGRVVAAIEPQLYSAEDVRAKRKPPESLDAWECVVRAMSLIGTRSQRDIAEARALLERAIVRDARYAQAHSLLAYVAALEALYGWTRHETALPLAWDAANKAMLLDRDDPWSHFAVGYASLVARRPQEAVEAHKRALVLNPNFALAHAQIGIAYASAGRGAEALAAIETAERLSPRDLFAGQYEYFRSCAHFVGGHYRDAVDSARKALQENPNHVRAHVMVMCNCALAGEIDEARAALAALVGLVPNLSREWVEQYTAKGPFVRAEDRQRILAAFQSVGVV